MGEKRSQFLKEQFERLEKAAGQVRDEDLLFSFRGAMYPALLCSAQTFEALEGMEAREDDVLVAAYPKTGTNWTLKILKDLVAAAYGDLQEPEHFHILEFGPPEKVESLKKQPSPRVLCTHLHYDNIPKSFIEKKMKILVVFRNPKDTAVSYYHFQNNNPVFPKVTWDEFFQNFMNGEVCWKSYFDHALVWDKHMDEANIMVITYEELKENLYEGVKQIADFYQLPLTDEKIKAVAEKSTFQEMKTKSQETLGSFAPVLFRKGVVGDWKALFTEAQSKEMDAKFEECLAGTKLGTKLKYDKYCKF